jgi:allophanate hydrolase
MDVAAVFDADEPYSRKKSNISRASYYDGSSFTYGVPKREQLQFFGNSEYQQAFQKSLETLDALNGKRMEIDFSPFLSAAGLLYDGPWVAERTAAIGEFLETNPEAGDPVVRKIICSAEPKSAVDFFNAAYELQTMKRKADVVMDSVDVVVTPTAGTCYTIAEVMADPIALNSHLGYYTNYMNLLDYCGIAVPTAFASTVPFGVTLVGKPFQEDYLLGLAGKLHQKVGLSMGTGSYLPMDYISQKRDDEIMLVVCGAHLKGLPLHHQLVELKARFIKQTTTAACYQMFALESTPPKPGLIRDEENGVAIEVEIYALSAASYGAFVAQIPHPLGIGKLELSDGKWVSGFIAEPLVSRQGKDITEFGGWRAYLKTKKEIL